LPQLVEVSVSLVASYYMSRTTIFVTEHEMHAYHGM